jgi:hypothetical protein
MNLAKSGLVVLALVGMVTACSPPLPESDSQEAKLYQRRCSGCHRLYAPGVLTAEMWGFMVARMEKEFRRRSIPPLTAEEKQAILSYLQLHSAKGS